MDEKNENHKMMDDDELKNNSAHTPPPIGQILSDAEQTIRKSLTTLSEWSEQARNLFENRPGVVLASVSIAGFMTGLLIRQGGLTQGRRKTDRRVADPLIVFATGALAGVTLGPRIFKEVFPDSASPTRSPLRDFGHH
jgi:hypothetical protein